jgi:hypothetical protein
MPRAQPPKWRVRTPAWTLGGLLPRRLEAGDAAELPVRFTFLEHEPQLRHIELRERLRVALMSAARRGHCDRRGVPRRRDRGLRVECLVRRDDRRQKVHKGRAGVPRDRLPDDLARLRIQRGMSARPTLRVEQTYAVPGTGGLEVEREGFSVGSTLLLTNPTTNPLTVTDFVMLHAPVTEGLYYDPMLGATARRDSKLTARRV